MLLSILFSIHLASASCEIPKPVGQESICPIKVYHLDQIEEFYHCRVPTGKPRHKKYKSVGECQGKAKTLNSALPFLPAAVFAGMTANQKALALSKFAKENLDDLADEIAEEEFSKVFRKPADKKKLRRLKNKLTRLEIKARSGGVEEKRALESFQKDPKNSGYLKALKKHKGKIGKVMEPFYKGVANAKGNIDIANMKFSEIPDNIVSSKDHPETLFKQKYKEHARRAVKGIQKQLRAGKAFRDISHVKGVTKDDLRSALQKFEKRALSFRDNKGWEKKVPFLKKGKSPKTKAAKGSGKVLKGVLKRAGLVGAAITAALLPKEKQDHCDKLFPHYPVSYSSPDVAGLPEEYSCKPVMPSLGKQAPEKVKAFLEKKASEKYEALSALGSENQETRYVCDYYRKLHNHLFCNQDQDIQGGVNTEK